VDGVAATGPLSLIPVLAVAYGVVMGAAALVMGWGLFRNRPLARYQHGKQVPPVGAIGQGAHRCGGPLQRDYLDGGAPMPRYLTPELLFDVLLRIGLLTLGQPARPRSCPSKTWRLSNVL